MWRATPTPVSWGDGTYLLSVLAAYADPAPGPRRLGHDPFGQDYPLRSLVDFEAHLVRSGADALLEDTPATGDERMLRLRYVRRSYRVPQFAARGATGRLVTAVPGLGWAPMPHGLRPMIERRVLRPPYPLRKVRRGNDLFAANGRAVERLLGAPERVLRHFERTPTPSEGYSHTVLMNDPKVVVRPEMLHFARWGASAHPDILGVEDLSAMLASGRWFARKFVEDDPVLDELHVVLDVKRSEGGDTPSSGGVGYVLGQRRTHQVGPTNPSSPGSERARERVAALDAALPTARRRVC